MSHAIVNEAYPLPAQYGDGSTSVYPRAFIYDSTGALLATSDLASISGGLYGSTVFFSSEGYFSVVYITYSDAAHTQVDTSYDREAEQVEVRRDAPAAVWDALVNDHLLSGSTGEALAIVRGLLQHNYILDNVTYNSKGLLLSGRIRVFRNKADTDAGINPIGSFTIAGTAEAAPNDALGKILKVTRDP